MNTYCRDVGRYKCLSQEEIRDLIKQAQGGNIAARNRVIEANLKLVLSTVRKFKYPPDLWMDLVSEANFALFKAVEKFDLTRKGKTGEYIKFSTFAHGGVEKHILGFLKNKV